LIQRRRLEAAPQGDVELVPGDGDPVGGVVSILGVRLGALLGD
jgi:hypothetical protein